MQVDVLAVGTGQAIALGERGDVDVLLVHARSLEEAFIASGYATERFDVMYNDFILVGPMADPAGIAIGPVPQTRCRESQPRRLDSLRADDSGT